MRRGNVSRHKHLISNSPTNNCRRELKNTKSSSRLPVKTRSKLRTKLSKASTKRSGCLLLSKQTKHKQKQNTQVSTPKVPSQRRSTPLEPNFHTKQFTVGVLNAFSVVLEGKDRSLVNRRRKTASWRVSVIGLDPSI